MISFNTAASRRHSEKNKRETASTVQEPGDSRPTSLTCQKFILPSDDGLGAAYQLLLPLCTAWQVTQFCLNLVRLQHESCLSKSGSETEILQCVPDYISQKSLYVIDETITLNSIKCVCGRDTHLFFVFLNCLNRNLSKSTGTRRFRLLLNLYL